MAETICEKNLIGVYFEFNSLSHVPSTNMNCTVTNQQEAIRMFWWPDVCHLCKRWMIKIKLRPVLGKRHPFLFLCSWCVQTCASTRFHVLRKHTTLCARWTATNLMRPALFLLPHYLISQHALPSLKVPPASLAGFKVHPSTHPASAHLGCFLLLAQI